MKFRVILLVLIATFMLLGTSFAAINIDNRVGAVKIFMPDNKQLIIQKGDRLPVIPDGALITILAGSATVSTTGKSKVSVSMGNYTITLNEKSKVNLILNPDGTVGTTIILGSADINRKPEPYHEPLPPAGTELLQSNVGEKKEISASQ